MQQSSRKTSKHPVAMVTVSLLVATWPVAPIGAQTLPAAEYSSQPESQNDPTRAPPLEPPSGSTGTAATPLASATPLAPPITTPAPACVPACREGFVCINGSCTTACNPPCGWGEVCSSDARCVASSPVEQATAQPEAALRARESERLKHRFTLLGGMDINYILDAHVLGIAAKATAGYRKNLSPEGGLAVRVGFAGGFATPSSTDNNSSGSTSKNDTVGLIKVEGEFAAYLSPGRFYIGPVVWGAHFGFGQGTLTDRVNGKIYHLPDAWKGGAGVDMGVLLGSREQFDLNWSLKSAFSRQLPGVFQIGAGWHFM